MNSNSQIKPLVNLYYDQDPYVTNAIKQELLQMGDDAVDQLSFIKQEAKTEEEFYKIEGVLNYILEERVVSVFEEMDSRNEFDFIKGIDALADLPLTHKYSRKFYELSASIADTLTPEISDNKTDLENIEIFNYLFFNKFFFKSLDKFTNSDQDNLIPAVVKSRQGNPLTITLIYFYFAKKLFLPIYPIAFTGGFVPVCLGKDHKPQFYINIFKEGEIFFENNFNSFLQRSKISINRESVQVKDDKYLLQIYLTLLTHHVDVNKLERQSSSIERIDIILRSEEEL